MSDPECMVILDDDDVIPIPKDQEQDEGNKIIRCAFDINEFITQTLMKLDVKAQIQDAICTSSTKLDCIETKAKVNDQIFRGLDERMARLSGFVTLLDAPHRSGAVVGPALQRANNLARSIDETAEGCVEVIPVGRVMSRPPSLPPNGTLVRKKLEEGSRVYVMKGSAYKGWLRAKVIEIKIGPPGKTVYKVKFDNTKLQSLSFIGKQLAYFDPADVLLPVGTRVIAHYKDEYLSNPKELYAGIVAEPPKIMNKYRYLIFFEDGFAQYVHHTDIRVVCETSPQVWEDIHPDMQAFIKTYIKQYPERAMVKLEVGHSLKTEWNGQWWMTVAKEVDASLVKVFFHVDSRTEWIYRGSNRLEPLYVQMATAEARRTSGKVSRRHSLAVTKRKSAPYVEYTRGIDEATGHTEASNESEPVETTEKKQVARKHTGGPPVHVPPAKKTFSGTARVVLHENDGTIEVRTPTSKIERRTYAPHMCSPACLTGLDDDPSAFKTHNPLTIPLYCGWERQVVRHKSVSKLVVFYKGPCGRRMRNMQEIFCYLGETKSKLSIDLFTTDSQVYVCGQFLPAKENCVIKDISYGKERIPVSAVNSLTSDYPEYVEYATKRIPNDGVDLNLDPEFLVGCDCEDDCADPSKCSCRQLTIEATKILKGDTGGEPKSGYTYRRLNENIVTGIYECNQRCKCSSRCLNRVVQNGLQLRLQVFKTTKRGWGMRCLDDIPKGCFICIYAGQLLNEERADMDGAQFGDEYLAELDYIEIVERIKDGYESETREDFQPDEVACDDQPCSKKDGGNKGLKATTRSKTSSLASELLEDSEGSNFSTEDNNKAAGDTSDSDFEAPAGEVAHRVHATRNKIQKLVLRRETSEQESNHSWSDVLSSSRSVQGGTEEGSSNDATQSLGKSKKDGGVTSKEQDKVDQLEKAGCGESGKDDDDARKKKQDSEKMEDDSEKTEGDFKNMKSDSEKVKGDSKKMEGDSEKVEGDSEKIEGDCEKVKGDSEKIEGDCEKVKGDSEKIEGNSEKVKGDSEKMEVGCENVEGNSEKMEGDCDKGGSEVGSGIVKVDNESEGIHPENNDANTKLDGDDLPDKKKGDSEKEKDGTVAVDKQQSTDIASKDDKVAENTSTEMMEVDPSADNSKSGQSTAEIVSEEEGSIASKVSSSEKDEGSALRNKSSFWSVPGPIEGDAANESPTRGTKKQHDSVRKLFGEENCYIMDAKSLGNVGRYLNHSCNPNVFSQTVFVDTHDLRFGWVSFFTAKFVRAGTELTWDYSYEVGSVPNKKLTCECGSTNCRGRLL